MSQFFYKPDLQAVRLGHHQSNQLTSSTVGYGSIAIGKNITGKGLYSLTSGDCDPDSRIENNGMSSLVLGQATQKSRFSPTGQHFTFLGQLSESRVELDQTLGLFSVRASTSHVTGQQALGLSLIDLEKKSQLDLDLSHGILTGQLTGSALTLGGSGSYHFEGEGSTLVCHGQGNQLSGKVKSGQLFVSSNWSRGCVSASGEGHPVTIDGSGHLFTLQTRRGDLELKGNHNIVSLSAQQKSEIQGSHNLVVGMGSARVNSRASAVVGQDHQVQTDASCVVGVKGKTDPGLPRLELALNGKHAGFRVTSGGDDPEIEGGCSSFMVEHSGYKEILEWGSVPFSDSTGLFVTLVEGKLALAEPNQKAIGVVAPQTGVVTGTAEHQHLDSLGKPVTQTDYQYSLARYLASQNLPPDTKTRSREEIKKKYDFEPYPVQINGTEGTDPLAKSQPRAGVPVTLLGRVRVRCDPLTEGWSVAVGSKGVAVSGDVYPVLKRISSTVVEILFK